MYFERKKYNQFSLELKYEAIRPISLSDNLARSKYKGFQNIQRDTLYRCNQKLGILGDAGVSSFTSISISTSF